MSGELRYTYICECTDTGIVKVGIGFNPYRRAVSHARRVLFGDVRPVGMSVIATFRCDMVSEAELIRMIGKYAPNARDLNGQILREWFVGGHSPALADIIFLLTMTETYAPQGALEVFRLRELERAGHGKN